MARRGDEFRFYVPESISGAVPVDATSSIVNHIKTRPYRRNPHAYHVPPHQLYSKDLLPPCVTSYNPSTALATKWVHTSFHKSNRKSIFYVLQWSPNGKRLLASANQGDIMIINPTSSFSREGTEQAHNKKIVASLAWGRVNDMILSGDESGTVKLWTSNFLLVGELNTNARSAAGKDGMEPSVRGISFSPMEHKFVTASADGSARVWDTERIASPDVSQDCVMEGHGGDVNTVEWHPFKSVVLTGSTDRDARLWDPRDASGQSIATLQGHAGPLTSVRWHSNGYTFLTAARDHTVRLWDLRTVRTVSCFRGHTGDVLSVQWHPTHSDLFTSAGMDGNICHWITSADGEIRGDGVKEITKDAATITGAHGHERGNVANRVNQVAWSPVGHLLASCCNEIKFFHRNKPGEMEDAMRGMEGNMEL